MANKQTETEDIIFFEEPLFVLLEFNSKQDECFQVIVNIIVKTRLSAKLFT